jgi:hypothetical protein
MRRWFLKDLYKRFGKTDERIDRTEKENLKEFYLIKNNHLAHINADIKSIRGETNVKLNKFKEKIEKLSEQMFGIEKYLAKIDERQEIIINKILK